MPVLHQYKKKDNCYILTSINGAVVTFQVTSEGHQRLIDSGIEPGERFGRGLLLELCRYGEAFTFNASPNIDLSGWTQIALDFANDPDPEELLSTCAACSSPYGLHVVEVIEPDSRYLSVRCQQCRDKDIAAIGMCIPTPLLTRQVFNRMLEMAGGIELDQAAASFKSLLEREFIQKWDKVKRGRAKAVQDSLFPISEERQAALL